MNNFRLEFWIADIKKHRDLLELCIKKIIQSWQNRSYSSIGPIKPAIVHSNCPLVVNVY